MFKMYFFIIEKSNFVENWCFKGEIWEIKCEILERKKLTPRRYKYSNLSFYVIFYLEIVKSSIGAHRLFNWNH